MFQIEFMKKIYFQLILFCLFFQSSFGQANSTENLMTALEKSTNDIEKTEILNQIATSHKNTNPKLMAEYAQKAWELSKKINHKNEQGTAAILLGTSEIMLGDYAKAIDYFLEAKLIFEQELAKSSEENEIVMQGLARTYGNMGVIFSEQNNYAKALTYHLKAVKIYEKLNDEARSAFVYNNIGIVYRAQNEPFKALDYFTKAYDLQLKLKQETLGITATNLGNLYLHQNEMDSAWDWYEKALQHFQTYPNPRGAGELENNIGWFYMKQKQPQNAVVHLEKALQYFDLIEDKFGKTNTYLFLSELHLTENEIPKALDFARTSLKLAQELNTIESVALAEKRLSEIFEMSNQPQQALIHFKAFNEAKSKMNENENIRKAVQAELDYHFEKKEALQKNELEKKALLLTEQAKLQNTQNRFIVISILLIFGIILLVYNRMHLKKTLTLQKELAEYEQKALHLQMNPHFVFNCLGSISSFIVQNGTDSALKYLSKFSKLMRLTLEYSKESLIPIHKEIESLQNYLELEQLRFNHVFDFEITQSDAIEDDMALPPLLLQPFVENAIIHGLIPQKKKGHLSIDFSIQDKQLICTVIDNGLGFETSKEMKENLVSLHKSMALDITKKRLEMMEASTAQKAKVNIQELKDEENKSLGTQVILQLPIQYIVPTNN